jgi:hypothetical protein
MGAKKNQQREEERGEPNRVVFEAALFNFFTTNCHWLTRERFFESVRRRIAKAMLGAAIDEIKRIKVEDVLRLAKWRPFTMDEPRYDVWVYAARGNRICLVRRKKCHTFDDVFVTKENLVLEATDLDAWIPVEEAKKIGWEEEF